MEAEFLTAVTGAYLLAGFVKGVIGMGLPTVAIGLLGLMVTPAQAAAILVVPSFATNVWQGLAGGELRALLRHLWPMTGICIGTFVGALRCRAAIGCRPPSGSGWRLRLTLRSACPLLSLPSHWR